MTDGDDYDEIIITDDEGINDISYTNPGSPLTATMGIDLITLFVRDDISIKIDISTKAGAIAVGATDKDGDGNYTLVDKNDSKEYSLWNINDDASSNAQVSIKPTGITPLAARLIYEYGISWEYIVNAGFDLIQVELLSVDSAEEVV